MTIDLRAALRSQTTTAELNQTVTKAGVATAMPAGYVPLDANSILLFCQGQLKELDKDIQFAMNKQQKMIGSQKVIGAVLQDIKGTSGDSWNNEERFARIEGNLTSAMEDAQAAGDVDLYNKLKGAWDTLHTENDKTLSKEEIKIISDTLTEVQTSLRSGAEMQMIDLQALVSKRSTTLQLTTGMMNSLNEGSKSIAGNIGR